MRVFKSFKTCKVSKLTASRGKVSTLLNVVRARTSRVSHLEEENRSLRMRLAGAENSTLATGQPSSSGAASPISQRTSPVHSPENTAFSSRASLSKLSISNAVRTDSTVDRERIYQGLTSASVLSDASASQTPSPILISHVQTSTNDVRRELEAEAARQRKPLSVGI